MPRAVIYIRVSSDEQVKGMSLDFQKQDCLAYAQKKQIDVAQIFEEKGESAKFADRPELIGLLEYCRKHRKLIDALIVWKLDRLSRNQLDYYYLKRTLLDLGVAIHSATEQSMEDSSSIPGKIFETFSALQAEIDNTVRSERAQRGLEAKIMTGIYPWKPPVGYLSNLAYKRGEKKIRPDEPDPILFPIIQGALREYASGRHSQRELLRLLDERGFAEARLTKTHPQIVNRLLDKYLNFYRGFLINPWSGEEIRGQHIPMISEEEYLRVVAVRDGRSLGRAVKRRRSNPLFPLRRFLICADCHHYFTGSVSRGEHGGRFPYYHCVTRGCPAYGKGIPKKTVEGQFAELMVDYRLSPGYLGELKLLLTEKLDQVGVESRRKTEQIEKTLAELEQKRKNIYEMREDGSYTKEEFWERRASIDKEINRAKLDRQESTAGIPDLERVFQYARQFIERFGEKWELMPESIAREFQNIVFPAGIEYRRKTGFGTPKACPIFNLDSSFFLHQSPEAGWRGFDWNPILADLKKLARLSQDWTDEFTDALQIP